MKQLILILRHRPGLQHPLAYGEVVINLLYYSVVALYKTLSKRVLAGAPAARPIGMLRC